MIYQVQESEEKRGAYVVTAIKDDGEVRSTLFSGPNAKERAEEYASWKNRELTPTHPP
jgi:hypothetical protein